MPPIAPTQPGSGVRIRSDNDETDQTTSTGRTFQHITLDQPAGPQEVPQIGGQPQAGPQRPAGDVFLGAVPPAGPQPNNEFQIFLLTLANAYRAAGPTGTVNINGRNISVQSVLDDPQNAAFRNFPQVQALITERNTQYQELKDKILGRLHTLNTQINDGTYSRQLPDGQTETIESIRSAFRGDPENGVLPRYDLRPNAQDSNQLDVIDAQGQVVAYRVHQGNRESARGNLEEIIRKFIVKRASVEEINAYSNTVRQRISQNPDLRATLDPNNPNPLYLSGNDINQIRSEVNQTLETEGNTLRMPDVSLSISDDAASEAVWTSIEYLAVASQYGRLVNAGNTAQWLAKYTNIANRASATAGRLTTPAYISRAERIARIARFNAQRTRLCFLARGASRFPTLATTSQCGASLATKGWGVGAVAKVGGRALPWLGAGYACVDTGLNGINAINAFAEGKSAEGWNQVARFAIKGGCMAAFCLIPGVGPLLGMTLGHLVGQGLEWLFMDGGLTKICDGISAGFKWLGEKLPVITKPLEIIAKPLVAIGSGIKKLWKSIFG